MKILKRSYIIVICIALILAILLFTPLIAARYQKTVTGGLAYYIYFPVQSDAQLNTLNVFQDILESSEAMAELQTVINNLEEYAIWVSRNYLSTSDVESLNSELFNNLLNPTTSDNSKPFFIIKFEKNVGEANRQYYAIFSTPTEVTATSGMVENISKSILKKVSDTEYEIIEPKNRVGEAIATGYDQQIGTNSYNTDYWAYKMTLEEEPKYQLDLNLQTDNDPSTNYNDQYYNFEGYNIFDNLYNNSLESAVDGYSFITFTPDEDGTYSLNIDKPFRVRYRAGDLKEHMGTATETTNYTATVEVTSGSYQLEMTGGTKYYFAIQMPSDADASLSYIVNIDITKV